jgi:hypothetical protein
MVAFRVLSRINLADRCSSNFSTSSISFASFGLRTLFLSLRSFLRLPSFVFNNFRTLSAKHPGVWVSQHFRAKLRSLRHMRHVAPLSPVASVDCAYFPSPRGCTPTCFRLLCVCGQSHWLALCFHIPLPRPARSTNPFSRLPAMAGLSAEAGNPFIFTSASGKPHR